MTLVVDVEVHGMPQTNLYHPWNDLVGMWVEVLKESSILHPVA